MQREHIPNPLCAAVPNVPPQALLHPIVAEIIACLISLSLCCLIADVVDYRNDGRRGFLLSMILDLVFALASPFCSHV